MEDLQSLCAVVCRPVGGEVTDNKNNALVNKRSARALFSFLHLLYSVRWQEIACGSSVTRRDILTGCILFKLFPWVLSDFFVSLAISLFIYLFVDLTTIDYFSNTCKCTCDPSF